MAIPKVPPEFDGLTTSEKVEFVQRLWDRIAADSDAMDLTDEQRAELDRRLAAYRENPEEVVLWDDVKARLQRKR